MSGIPTINVVEDEQMSSEGSVNAPVAPPRSPSVHSARATSPVEPVDLLSGRVSPIAKTLQAGSAGRERSASVFSPIPPTEVVGAPFSAQQRSVQSRNDTSVRRSLFCVTRCVVATRGGASGDAVPREWR